MSTLKLLGAFTTALLLPGCDRQSRGDAEGEAAGLSPVVARYKGGTVTQEELQREANRLPLGLREQFQTEFGRKELALSLVDKRLLVDEARRRGLAEDAETKRRVRELEERLIVQALLAAEERAAGTPTEAELRTYYDAHKTSFAQPERVHVARVLAQVPAGAGAAERARARGRAEAFLKRLRAGEAFSKVQASGDGPERARAGDFGQIARGDLKDRRLEDAAFSLSKAGELSSVVETADGFAVLRLIERKPGRVPPFEEVRAEVQGRIAPVRQRKVFDELRARLRKDAEVKVELSVRP